MMRRGQTDSGSHTFDEIRPQGAPVRDSLGIEDLRKVNMTVTVDLGKRRMQVRDVLELKVGSVIQLDKLAGEMIDVSVNDLPLARGEVVVIGDSAHIRVTEILGAGERSEQGYD